jgi:hypothetical protein
MNPDLSNEQPILVQENSASTILSPRTQVLPMNPAIIVIAALLLTACSGGILQPTAPTPVPDDVTLTTIPNRPAETKLRLRINRNGFDGPIQMTLENLPNGTNVSRITLEPKQNWAIFTLKGLPKNIGSSIKATVRYGNLEISRSIPLNAAELTVDLPGGTHSQSIRNINANVDQSDFGAHQIYANFKGSQCQIMIRSLTGGLYVCFNAAVRAGETYDLTTERGDIPGTASITYFQGPATTSSQHGFWDSTAGKIRVLAVSSEKIDFSIVGARFVPAKYFEQNLAVGEFMLEASSSVTNISNLP